MTIGANGNMDEVAFDLIDKKIAPVLSVKMGGSGKHYWWTRA
jgi:hypothetical protein